MNKFLKYTYLLILLSLSTILFAAKCPNCNYNNPDSQNYCGRCAYNMAPKKTKKPIKKSAVRSLPALTMKNTIGFSTGLLFALIIVLIAWRKRKKHQDYIARMNMQRTSLTMTTQLRMQNMKAGLDVDKGHPERRFERLEVKIPVRYKLPMTDELTDSTVVDVSQGGLCFLVTRELEPGSRIEVIFKNDDEDISVAGEVTSCLIANKQFFRAGLKFYHLFKKQQDFIDSIIQSKK